MKVVAMVIAACTAASGQTKPATTQAGRDCVVNIQGNSNIATVTCHNVDKKLADQISQLVAESKRDGKTLKDISDKMDTLLDSHAQTTSVVQQAPNGINIGPGAIAPNPQVNNFGPPPANITWTEEVITPLSDSGTSEKVMRVHIRTDRSIPGAVIGVIFSGAITMTEEYWKAYSPTLTPSGAFEIDISAPLSRNGATIPNSMALRVTLPSAFSSGQDLAFVATSKVDVHLLAATDITR